MKWSSSKVNSWFKKYKIIIQWENNGKIVYNT